MPRRGIGLRPAWLIDVMFLGLVAWWALGVSGFIEAVVGIPMLIALYARGGIRMPRAFLLWLFFLFWMFVTGVQVHHISHIVSYTWRGGLYIAAGVLFLYVFNFSRRALPTSSLVKAMALFFVLTVMGGVLGMLLPKLSFTTLFEKLLPASLVAGNRFVFDLVHASTASLNAFAGTSIHRPKAPFIYTNQWGSAYALSLPFAIAALMGGEVRSRLWRTALIVVIGFSLLPLIISLDRGSWLSAAVSIGYATLRLAFGRNRRWANVARALIVGAVLIALVIFLSPLWAIIKLRLSNGYGDKTRALLYESSIQAVSQSPIFGYGTPVSLTLVNPNAPLVGPSVGTHGQFWTIIVSHGVPGIVLFIGWWGFAFVKTGKRLPERLGRDGNARFWAHVSILAGIIQMPYYELIPWGLFIMMLAAGLAFREAEWEPPSVLAGRADPGERIRRALGPRGPGRMPGLDPRPRQAAPRTNTP
jgi:hypothetical protein